MKMIWKQLELGESCFKLVKSMICWSHEGVRINKGKKKKDLR